MKPFKIGTLADWFGEGVIGGIKASCECGAQGVQLYATKEMDPRTIRPDFKADVMAALKEYNQEVAALCAELEGHGLAVAEENRASIPYYKKVMDMALEMGSKVVTFHIGIIPADKDHPRYKVMLEGAKEIAKYAESVGGHYALETGPETIATMKAFIEDVGYDGIAVNYDPANLVMRRQDDEVQGVYTAGKLIVHTHAKDGVFHKYVDPEVWAEEFATGGIELVRTRGYSTETPLGEGEVRFPEYLKALRDVGYNGFLTIEREVGKEAAKDIVMAVNFLNRMMDQMQ